MIITLDRSKLGTFWLEMRNGGVASWGGVNMEKTMCQLLDSKLFVPTHGWETAKTGRDLG